MATYTPIKQKPDLPNYPVETLEICQRFDRTAFEKAFGEQPPAFDPNKPPKVWFDTAENAGNYIRYPRDVAGKPSATVYTMTRELAASLNIPGAYRYPRYVIENTAAEVVLTSSDGTITRIPVDPGQLAFEAQARALAIAIGGTTELDQSWYANSVDWKTEPRRLYYIVLNGEPANAGHLLQAQAINGVAAPGHWSGFQWVPDAQITAPLDPKVQEIPVPCRALDSDEEFRSAFGGRWEIWKKSVVTSPVDETLRLIRMLLDRLGVSY